MPWILISYKAIYDGGIRIYYIYTIKKHGNHSIEQPDNLL